MISEEWRQHLSRIGKLSWKKRKAVMSKQEIASMMKERGVKGSIKRWSK